MSNRWVNVVSAVTVAAACCLGASSGTAPAGKPRTGFEVAYPAASALAKAVGRQCDAALDGAVDDLPAALHQSKEAFDLVVRYGTARDVDAFREAAFTHRLLRQLTDGPADDRADLLAFLRAHPALAHTLAFAVNPGRHVAGTYELLDTLRRERPKQLADFPELAVALCVVRDRPLVRHINENKVAGADPLAVFDYYVAHERQMAYGLRGVPVELLTYVVDTTASVADMTWALNRYAGDKDVGALFFKIKYDYAYYDGKADKKVDKADGGYTLPNVLAYGGVCVDQAYFAESVGKAIGVPTAMATATSGEAGHAWVGFLRTAPNGRAAAWDFNSGRYPEYQGLRGNVTDAQTGDTVADSTVGMLGDLIGTTAVQRQNAVALVDAALELGKAEGDAPPSPVPTSSTLAAKPRAATADGQLDLIELGLKQYAPYPRGWRAVADLAKDGGLSLPQKKRWADLAMRLCGTKHPDFAVQVLTPMVETVPEPAEQSGLWDAIFNLVKARPDLAAEVRFRQAALWQKADDLPKAGQAYADVVAHYLNAGPFAVKALAGAESVLRKMNRVAAVLDLYADAAKRVAKPSDGGRAEFVHQSNWYKVRQAYADKLAEAGQKGAAEQIRAEDQKGT